VKPGHRRLAPRPAGAGRGAAGLVAIASVAGLAAGACGKDSLPAGEVTPEVATMLEHLPGDAWAVVGIHAARVRAVPALARLLEWLPEAPVPPIVAESCGLDPRRGLDLAVAAIGGAGGPDSVFVAMKGSFRRDAIGTCIIELSDRTREAMTAVQDGSVTVYGARKQRGHVYWPTREIAVVAPEASNAAAALNAIAGQPGVRTDERLMSYVGRVRTRAAFWMAGPLPPDARERMAGLGPGVPALQGFFVTADGEEDGRAVRVVLGLRLAGEAEAEAAARTFREQRGALAAVSRDPRVIAVVNKLQLARSGAEVVLQASLDAAETRMLIDMVAGLTGMPAAESRP
jgi:hypothetical protein